MKGIFMLAGTFGFFFYVFNYGKTVLSPRDWVGVGSFYFICLSLVSYRMSFPYSIRFDLKPQPEPADLPAENNVF